jgi:hypothetical protein
MRMPSASFCHRSTILLSSSSAALEYMEKKGPELSPKLDSPRDGGLGVGWGSSAIGEVKVRIGFEKWMTHLLFPPRCPPVDL